MHNPSSNYVISLCPLLLQWYHGIPTRESAPLISMKHQSAWRMINKRCFDFSFADFRIAVNLSVMCSAGYKLLQKVTKVHVDRWAGAGMDAQAERRTKCARVWNVHDVLKCKYAVSDGCILTACHHVILFTLLCNNVAARFECQESYSVWRTEAKLILLPPPRRVIWRQTFNNT